MRQLLPFPADDVEPYDVYRLAQATRFVRINMVASVDGSVTDSEGRAGGLGGDGDWRMFRALRALADGILVGAGTARLEGYGPHRLPAGLAARRRADGRADPAAIIVVSRSLQLDPDAPLFAEARTPTIVLTCAAAPADRRRLLERRAQVLQAGDDTVDLAGALRLLSDVHGINQIVCEGGPLLNRHLLESGTVDELCITFAPLLTGSAGENVISPPATAAALDLVGLCEQDGELYARYAIGHHGA